MLTLRKKRFVEAYKKTNGNASEAARIAGYSPNRVSSAACRLMQDIDISKHIKDWQAESLKELSRENYTKMAFRDYEALPLTHANRPRFFEIMGKAAGFLKEETNINAFILNAGDMKKIRERILGRLEKKSNRVENKSNSNCAELGDSVSDSPLPAPSGTQSNVDSLTNNDDHLDGEENARLSEPENFGGEEGPRGGSNLGVNPLPNSPTILKIVKND